MDTGPKRDPMTAVKTCAQCGTSLDVFAPRGICPRCVLQAGLLSDAGDDSLPGAGSLQDSRTVKRFGDYELLEELGHGGMGVVYRAKHVKLDRIVALKMLLLGQFSSDQAVQRFQREARAAASLRHPNIVALHDIGQAEGQHFLTMEFIEGRPLSSWLRDGPLAPRQAAAHLCALAEAVSAAHEAGIVHRDLKPSNILIDIFEQPRITDFGLAKRLDGSGDITLSGHVLGSPNYLAPELTTGLHEGATPATDIYALGAILYACLTGRPPFLAATLHETLLRIGDSEPVAPRVLDARLPLDLETICLKCLEKAPNRRYASAKELAVELSRFLKGEPVHARPVSRTERVWRWCLRKPALATAYATVLVLFLAVVLGAPVAILRVDRARLQAERAHAESERNLYAADMRLASEALRDGSIKVVQELLQKHEPRAGAEDLRGFEWRYLRHASEQADLVTRSLQGLSGPKIVTDCHLVLNGRTLYDVQEGTDQILAWDTVIWAPVSLEVPPARVSERWWLYPAQQAALAINDQSHTITVHRLPGFEETVTVSLPGTVLRVALSDDLRTLAVAFQDGPVQGVLVHDLSSKFERRIFEDLGGRATCLRFSPDGRVLMCACQGGAIGLWSVPEGKSLPSPTRNASSPEEDWSQAPFFGLGSTKLYLTPGRARNALEVWDWTTGKSNVYQAPVGRLYAVSMSPDGSTLAAAGSTGVIDLLNTKELRRVGVLPVRGGPIYTLAFSPSGNLLAGGGVDRSTILWDVKRQCELQTLGGNENTVVEVAFTPDEKSLLTRMGDGQITIWDLSAVLGGGLLWRTTNSIEGFTISSDERAIATKDNLGNVHVWDLMSGAHLKSVAAGQPNSTALWFAMAFSPTTQMVAWAGCSTFGILDYQSGQSQSFPLLRPGSYSDPAFSPDGRELAVAAATNILILDMATRRCRQFAATASRVWGLTFSPNGKLLASTHDNGTLTLWDRASGQRLTNRLAHATTAFDAAFSPDGRLLATSGLDKTGKLWDVTARGLKFRLALRGFVGRVGVLFSPDGRRVASARKGDNSLDLWDTGTGLEVGTIYGRPGGFFGFAFSRDGNSIYSAAEDGEVRLWRAPALGTEELSGTDQHRPNSKTGQTPL